MRQSESNTFSGSAQALKMLVKKTGSVATSANNLVYAVTKKKPVIQHGNNRVFFDDAVDVDSCRHY
jgi:hypothetical protein